MKLGFGLLHVLLYTETSGNCPSGSGSCEVKSGCMKNYEAAMKEWKYLAAEAENDMEMWIQAMNLYQLGFYDSI